MTRMPDAVEIDVVAGPGVEGEWALVALAYNCRRLNNMRLA